jgi:hypothetical protein
MYQRTRDTLALMQNWKNGAGIIRHFRPELSRWPQKKPSIAAVTLDAGRHPACATLAVSPTDRAARITRGSLQVTFGEVATR